MNASLQRLEQGKLYYSISEVCRMTGLDPHVLRYWETEFPHMRPKKNRAGNRAYRTKEIQYVHYIRHLLHDEKYTIQGAKKKLIGVPPEEIAGQLTLLGAETLSVPANREGEANDGTSGSPDLRKALREVRDGLRETLRLLEVKA
jgi:DNA-binding transcriptional MerR regulator